MKKFIIDNDIQTVLQTIKDMKEKTLFVYFTGSKDGSGISWCPDCNVAEPVVNKVFAGQDFASDDFVFITAYVGDRNTWKDPNNGFRKEFKLKSVPTLINWNSSNRLEENQLFDEELIKMLAED